MKFYLKKITLYIFGIIPFMYGCQGQPESTNFGKKSKIRLKEQYSYGFRRKTFLAYNGKKLICWNNSINTIKKFDLKKRVFYEEHKSKIKHPWNYKEIVNIGTDSILLYSLFDNYSIILVNYKGDVLHKYNVTPRLSKNISSCEKKRHPSCHLYGTNINTTIDDNFYYAAYNMGENKVSGKLYSGGRLNIKTGKFEYFTEFPQIYHEHNWGAIYYYFPYITNNGSKQIIVSYPASHNLFVYDIKTDKIKKVNGGSSLFKSIKPYSNKKELILELKDDYTKYYFCNYAYTIIAYDKNREFYYRMTKFPDTNYGKSFGSNSKQSIIVLDKDFNFVGEAMLPSNKEYTKLIVANDGIILPYYDFNNKKSGFTLFKVNIL